MVKELGEKENLLLQKLTILATIHDLAALHEVFAKLERLGLLNNPSLIELHASIRDCHQIDNYLELQNRIKQNRDNRLFGKTQENLHLYFNILSNFLSVIEISEKPVAGKNPRNN